MAIETSNRTTSGRHAESLSPPPIPSKYNLNIAPGARILVRSEEWLVRTAEPSADGGRLIVCEGISELVRGVEAHFLTRLEEDIRVLDPADTLLVADDTRQYLASLLYIESLRLRSTPNDSKIRLSHKSVMKPHAYQFDPARIALKQPRTRILIADTVGLGKTLEAGILATELIQRGRGKRILVITLKSMLTQFQKEWWARFSIPLVRLDSVGLARVRDRIPANHNPFNYYDKTIISMDTLKNNLEYRNYLEKAYWDIIVIDECHNVAMRANDQGSSLRARLARLLSKRSDSLILLSATPHDGSARSFASLIHLLDRTVIPDPDNYTPDDFREKGLVVRRFKKDIQDQVQGDFQERVTASLTAEATQYEEFAYEALLAIPFTQAGKKLSGRNHELQRIGMQKALFSSPAAAIQSAEERVKRLAKNEVTFEDVDHEIAALHAFLDTLRRIEKPHFSKYQLLLDTLQQGEHRWKGDDPEDRLVLFSERIETLNWLQTNLSADLNLKANQVALLYGGMSDTEQQSIVDRFGRKEDPVRLLLCSDVASEGLNLHYFCHSIVHFDMPWSLMTYLQRNGRVDRFGQTQKPFILYLQTLARNERIRGDQRILEVLRKKDEQANTNLGDPLAFLDKYDAEEEEEVVAETMADGLTANAFDLKMDDIAAHSVANEFDMFNAFFSSASPIGEPDSPTSTPEGREPVATEESEPVDIPSLFGDHYRFASSALELLNLRGRGIQWHGDDTTRTISLTAPRDLQARLRQIPREAQSTSQQYLLNPGVSRVMEAMEEARQAKAEENTWPKIQYLWPQHPIFEWIADSIISEFRGHRAPVIRSNRLAQGEMAFLIAGTIPNRKGQPIILDWQVACCRPTSGTDPSNHSFTREPFESFLNRAGLAVGTLPNPGTSVPPELQTALPGAVETMRQQMIREQADFAAAIQPRLARMLTDLDSLRERQLTLNLPPSPTPQGEASRRGAGGEVGAVRGDSKAEDIERDFEAYRAWIHDTMETEPQPFLQVVAAFHNLQ